MSRLMRLPPWGKDHSRQQSLSFKVKCHSLADLPIFSFGSCPHPRFSPLHGPLSHNALTFKKVKLKHELVLSPAYDSLFLQLFLKHDLGRLVIVCRKGDGLRL